MFRQALICLVISLIADGLSDKKFKKCPHLASRCTSQVNCRFGRCRKAMSRLPRNLQAWRVQILQGLVACAIHSLAWVLQRKVARAVSAAGAESPACRKSQVERAPIIRRSPAALRLAMYRVAPQWSGRKPTGRRACRWSARPPKASRQSFVRHHRERCRSTTLLRRCCSKVCRPDRIFSTGYAF